MNDIIPASTSDDEPRQTPMARWSAPAWATTTRLDGVLRHTRTGESVPCEIEGRDAEIAPEAYQADDLEVRDGVIRVVREGEPEIFLEGIRLSLAAAHNLGIRLCNLVEDIEAIAGLEVTR